MEMLESTLKARLEDTLRAIRPADAAATADAKQYLDGLLKPVGSLGKLERIAARIAGMTGSRFNEVARRAIVIMAADNGICAEGVSSAPVQVTAVMTTNFLTGGTGVTVLAEEAKASLRVVDIGIATDLALPGLDVRKRRNGTDNMRRGPAMTRLDALHAICTGIDVAGELADSGIQMLGTGEMGIGNTSTSSAVLHALTGLPLETLIGRGAGMTDEQLAAKTAAIRDAIMVNGPFSGDPVEALAKVGGLDIAGLCGVFLGAAARRIPVVIDGFISSVAALCAFRLCPDARDCMIPSHLSEEAGAQHVCAELRLEPMLNMNMRLGEGSGAALAFPIVDAALAVIRRMKTFEQGLVDPKDYVDKWKEEELP